MKEGIWVAFYCDEEALGGRDKREVIDAVLRKHNVEIVESHRPHVREHIESGSYERLMILARNRADGSFDRIELRFAEVKLGR